MQIPRAFHFWLTNAGDDVKQGSFIYNDVTADENHETGDVRIDIVVNIINKLILVLVKSS